MDKEKVFVDGVVWQDPHEKAPAFIKGNLVINAEKFSNFLKENTQYISEKGWIKIVMKESQKGTIYFEVDTWKPTPKPVEETTMTSPGVDGEVIDTADMPF